MPSADENSENCSYLISTGIRTLGIHILHVSDSGEAFRAPDRREWAAAVPVAARRRLAARRANAPNGPTPAAAPRPPKTAAASQRPCRHDGDGVEHPDFRKRPTS